MRYRSRPSEIEAVQWTGENREEVEAFGATITFVVGELRLKAGRNGESGWVTVPTGSWIARSAGDAGDHWPLDPDHLARKYVSIDGWADRTSDDQD